MDDNDNVTEVDFSGGKQATPQVADWTVAYKDGERKEVNGFIGQFGMFVAVYEDGNIETPLLVINPGELRSIDRTPKVTLN